MSILQQYFECLMFKHLATPQKREQLYNSGSLKQAEEIPKTVFEFIMTARATETPSFRATTGTDLLSAAGLLPQYHNQLPTTCMQSELPTNRYSPSW